MSKERRWRPDRMINHRRLREPTGFCRVGLSTSCSFPDDVTYATSRRDKVTRWERKHLLLPRGGHCKAQWHPFNNTVKEEQHESSQCLLITEVPTYSLTWQGRYGEQRNDNRHNTEPPRNPIGWMDALLDSYLCIGPELKASTVLHGDNEFDIRSANPSRSRPVHTLTG